MTTFQANDDQPTLWASKLGHKCHESGIMVSDQSISERDGYLALTEEYQKANRVDSTIRMYAWQQMEYGEAKEG